jgi:hypothetical protein
LGDKKLFWLTPAVSDKDLKKLEKMLNEGYILAREFSVGNCLLLLLITPKKEG